MDEAEAEKRIKDAGFKAEILEFENEHPVRVENIGNFWTWQGAYTYMIGAGLIK